MTPEEQKELEELEAQREAVQKQRDARAATEELPFRRQELADLQRVNELEEEHGDKRVLSARLNGWVPNAGAVTRIAVRAPRRSDHSYQRWQQLIWSEIKNRRNGDSRGTKANEQLGRMALAYPHPEEHPELFKATLEIAPAMLSDAANLAVRLASTKEEEDAKKSMTS